MTPLPHILVIDLDGVLTDGRLTIDHRGEKLFKQFHTRDVRAIRELVASGYEVYIVSADDWAGGRCFAEKVGAEFVYMKDKSQVPAYIGSRPYIAIGDDAWDVPMLEEASQKFCPQDADIIVKLLPGMRMVQAAGGTGVVAAIVKDLLT